MNAADERLGLRIKHPGEDTEASFVAWLGRPPAFGNIPKAESTIRSRLARVVIQIASIVLSILPHRIHYDALFGMAKAQSDASVGIDRHLGKIPRHEIRQLLWPAALSSSITLNGDHHDAAAQVCRVALKRIEHFRPRRGKNSGNLG